MRIPFYMSSQIIAIVCLFDWWMWSGITCGFDLHFTNEVEHLSIGLLTIYVFSLEKWQIKSSVCFLIGPCCCCYWTWTDPLYTLDINPLSVMWLANYFFLICELSFHFLSDVIWSIKVLFLVKSNLLIFFFIAWLSVSHRRNCCLTQGHEDLFLHILPRVL